MRDFLRLSRFLDRSPTNIDGRKVANRLARLFLALRFIRWIQIVRNEEREGTRHAIEKEFLLLRKRIIATILVKVELSASGRYGAQWNDKTYFLRR